MYLSRDMFCTYVPSIYAIRRSTKYVHSRRRTKPNPNCRCCCLGVRSTTSHCTSPRSCFWCYCCCRASSCLCFFFVGLLKDMKRMEQATKPRRVSLLSNFFSFLVVVFSCNSGITGGNKGAGVWWSSIWFHSVIVSVEFPGGFWNSQFSETGVSVRFFFGCVLVKLKSAWDRSRRKHGVR